VSLATFVLFPYRGGQGRNLVLCLLFLVILSAANMYLIQVCPRHFWILHAYLVMIHMIQQAVFFLRGLQRNKGVPYRTSTLDRNVLLVLCLAPILIWHADPMRGFDWYGESPEELDTHLVSLPDFLEPLLIVCWVLAIVVGLGRCIAIGDLRLAFLLSSTCISWAVGVNTPQGVAQVFLNLPHAAPSLCLHWGFLQRQKSFLVWISAACVCMMLALGEDCMWGSFIVRSGGSENNMDWRDSALMGALLAPHTLHCLVDSLVIFQWTNRATMDALGVDRTERGELL